MSGSSLPKIKSQFQPILLKGHERSITQVKFNRDGDLLFSCSKDHNPTVWYTETGERIGTYGFHKGAVWDLDANWDSTYLLTACGDCNARLFECTTGNYIARMPSKGVVRACTWGEGSRLFATASDPFNTREFGLISIYEFPSEDVLSERPHRSEVDNAPTHIPLIDIPVDSLSKAFCLDWSVGNEHILAGFDNGLVIKYDTQYGKEVARQKIHDGRVNRLTFSVDKTMVVTASADTTAKLINPDSLEVIRTFKTSTPVNGAVLHPTHPHVLIGGGQDAMSVTVTGASAGKFETRFFHTIYGEEFGRVKGHFGPINALAMHPGGKAYASGSEDGFIRLHHFDQAYVNASDLIPEDLKAQFSI